MVLPSVVSVTLDQPQRRHSMENSRNKHLPSFKLNAILSSMMTSRVPPRMRTIPLASVSVLCGSTGRSPVNAGLRYCSWPRQECPHKCPVDKADQCFTCSVPPRTCFSRETLPCNILEPTQMPVTRTTVFATRSYQ